MSMDNEVSWVVRSQPSLQCTTTDVFPDSTLSAILKAPAKINYRHTAIDTHDPAESVNRLVSTVTSFSPWCAPASEWTPNLKANGRRRCWDRWLPSPSGETLSSHGCCECPRTPAQHSDTHPHFQIHPLSSASEQEGECSVQLWIFPESTGFKVSHLCTSYFQPQGKRNCFPLVEAAATVAAPTVFKNTNNQLVHVFKQNWT